MSSPFSGATRAGGRGRGWRRELCRSGKAFRSQPLVGGPLDQASHGNRSPAALPMGGKKPLALADEAECLRVGAARFCTPVHHRSVP